MAAQPNWYPDPKSPDNSMRWWDGLQWTNHVQPKKVPVVPEPQQVIQKNNDYESNDIPSYDVAPLPIANIPSSSGYSDDAYSSVNESRERKEETIKFVGIEEAVDFVETVEINESFSSQPMVPQRNNEVLTPYTIKQLKRQLKSKEITKPQYKIAYRQASKRLSNTRYTSWGGFAFTMYLLAYPAVLAAGVLFFGLAFTDLTTTLASLNFSPEKLAKTLETLEGLADFAPEYNAFRGNFIIATVASTAIPFTLGLIGTFRKKGRVWAVATMLLALAFNPAIMIFGAPTNLSWWVLSIGL